MINALTTFANPEAAATALLAAALALSAAAVAVSGLCIAYTAKTVKTWIGATFGKPPS